MNVVITGGSRGFGKSIAEKFAANGHSLFLNARNQQTLQQTTDELRDRFPGLIVKSKACDLGTRDGVEEFGEWITGHGVVTDVLVNNAGTFIPGNVHDEPEGALEEIMAVNLYSAYHLTRKLLPGMMQRKAGHIFNMCSIAALQAYKNGG